MYIQQETKEAIAEKITYVLNKNISKEELKKIVIKIIDNETSKEINDEYDIKHPKGAFQC